MVAQLTQIRAHWNDPLTRNSTALIANTIINSLLGFAFWIVAARLYPTGTVGRDSALISAMITISSVAQLNLHSILLRFLPTISSQAGRLLAIAYVASIAAALLLSGLFILVVSGAIDSLSFLSQGMLFPATFCFAVAFWGIFALEDAALTAVRKAAWIPLENSLFGVGKLLLLPVAVAWANGVFLAWVIPMLVLLLPVNYLLYRALRDRPSQQSADRAASTLPRGRALGFFLVQDYLGSIAVQLVLTLMPILVVGTLGGVANAHFYMPFTIISVIDAVIVNIATSYTVEVAHEPSDLTRLTRRILKRSTLLLALAVVVVELAAPLILSVFGADYAREGSTAMRLLILASPIRGLLVIYSAYYRLTGNGRRILLVQVSQLIVLVPLVPVLADYAGLPGVAAAWLIAAWAVGLPAAFDFRRRMHQPVRYAASSRSALEPEVPFT